MPVVARSEIRQPAWRGRPALQPAGRRIGNARAPGGHLILGVIVLSTLPCLTVLAGCATRRPPPRARRSSEVRAWDELASPAAYFGQVLSPWDKGVVNPLGDALARVPDRSSKTAIDLGTGIGNGIPMLAEAFRQVTAVDFSPKMVEAARSRHQRYRNLTCAVADMRDLAAYHGRFDVVVAVNSVLSPSTREVDRMLLEAQRTTRPGGWFFGIFPSMESLLWVALVSYEHALGSGQDEEKAWKDACEYSELEGVDFVSGALRTPELRQKYYYQFELAYRLRKAGFTEVHVSKVLYPPSLWKEGAAARFEGQPPLWDWFVTARKPPVPVSSPPRVAVTLPDK